MPFYRARAKDRIRDPFMIKRTKIALGALLAVSAFISTAGFASAQYYDEYGRAPPPRFAPQQDWNRPPPPPPGYGRPSRGCDPRLAEDRARDFGFRRAHVVDITPRRVVVQGWTRRGPDEISFANARGCPALRR
jgi:hypothetical protein